MHCTRCLGPGPSRFSAICFLLRTPHRCSPTPLLRLQQVLPRSTWSRGVLAGSLPALVGLASDNLQAAREGAGSVTCSRLIPAMIHRGSITFVLSPSASIAFRFLCLFACAIPLSRTPPSHAVPSALHCPDTVRPCEPCRFFRGVPYFLHQRVLYFYMFASWYPLGYQLPTPCSQRGCLGDLASVLRVLEALRTCSSILQCYSRYPFTFPFFWKGPAPSSIIQHISPVLLHSAINLPLGFMHGYASSFLTHRLYSNGLPFQLLLFVWHSSAELIHHLMSPYVVFSSGTCSFLFLRSRAIPRQFLFSRPSLHSLNSLFTSYLSMLELILGWAFFGAPHFATFLSLGNALCSTCAVYTALASRHPSCAHSLCLCRTHALLLYLVFHSWLPLLHIRDCGKVISLRAHFVCPLFLLAPRSLPHSPCFGSSLAPSSSLPCPHLCVSPFSTLMLPSLRTVCSSFSSSSLLVGYTFRFELSKSLYWSVLSFADRPRLFSSFELSSVICTLGRLHSPDSAPLSGVYLG